MALQEYQIETLRTADVVQIARGDPPRISDHAYLVGIGEMPSAHCRRIRNVLVYPQLSKPLLGALRRDLPPTRYGFDDDSSDCTEIMPHNIEGQESDGIRDTVVQALAKNGHLSLSIGKIVQIEPFESVALGPQLEQLARQQETSGS